MVFDDLFETVLLQGYNDSTVEAICSDIFDINIYWYGKEEFGYAVNLINWPPPLHVVWLNEWGRRDWKQELERQRKSTEDRLHGRNCVILEIVTLNTNNDDYFLQ